MKIQETQFHTKQFLNQASMLDSSTLMLFKILMSMLPDGARDSSLLMGITSVDIGQLWDHKYGFFLESFKLFLEHPLYPKTVYSTDEYDFVNRIDWSSTELC